MSKNIQVKSPSTNLSHLSVSTKPIPKLSDRYITIGVAAIDEILEASDTDYFETHYFDETLLHKAPNASLCRWQFSGGILVALLPEGRLYYVSSILEAADLIRELIVEFEQETTPGPSI